jgi:hypothetical protein
MPVQLKKGDRVKVTHQVEGTVNSLEDGAFYIRLDKVDPIGRTGIWFPGDATFQIIAPPAEEGAEITTVEGLDALPPDTICREKEGLAVQKSYGGRWYRAGRSEARFPSEVHLPVKVVSLPKT